MAESLPNLVMGYEPDGRCDYISRQWVEYTGVPEREQLGWGWLERVHPEDRDRVQADWRVAVAAGTRFDAEFRIRSSSGGYRWFKTRAVPIRDAEGALQKWYGTATDIDDVKVAADVDRLKLDRLAPLLENIRDGFLLVDENLAITFFNAAAEIALERKRVDVIGEDLFEMLPDLRSATSEKDLKRALRDKVSLSFEAPPPGGTHGGRYAVQIHPLSQPAGLLIFVRREERAQARVPPP